MIEYKKLADIVYGFDYIIYKGFKIKIEDNEQ